MTPEAIAVRGFLTLVAIGGLCAVCCGLRAYGRDSFRQRAFAIRDELFDVAAAGQISFTDPAYWRLRMMMNIMIQYSHRLTFGEALLPGVVDLLRGRPERRPPEHHRAWLKAMERQPKDVRERLNALNARFNVLLVTHLLRNTPLAWPLLLAIALMYGIRVSVKQKLIDGAPSIEAEALREMDGDFFGGQVAAA